MGTILSIRGLNKKFGRVHAVKDLSLEIRKGNVYGILGPNGSGKSTTLGIVLNVVNRTSGDFEWFEGKLTTQEALKKVGAIIERPNFYPYMTARQNLRLVCQIKGAPYEKVEEKLALVGLLERADSKFKTFSLGMKQRLAIASALVSDPEILILDEPTNGLDPQGIHQIRDLIRKIASMGTTILLASHLLDEVEKVCSHVLVIKKGAMLFSGSVAELTASNGFFELRAQDMAALATLLGDHPAIGSVTNREDCLIAYPNADLDPAALNDYLFSKGMTLSHLVKRKASLEEQFLLLTEKH